MFSDFYSEKLDQCDSIKLDYTMFDLDIISSYLDFIYCSDVMLVKKLGYVEKIKLLEFLHHEDKTIDEG